MDKVTVATINMKDPKHGWVNPHAVVEPAHKILNFLRSAQEARNCSPNRLTEFARVPGGEAILRFADGWVYEVSFRRDPASHYGR